MEFPRKKTSINFLSAQKPATDQAALHGGTVFDSPPAGSGLYEKSVDKDKTEINTAESVGRKPGNGATQPALAAAAALKV